MAKMRLYFLLPLRVYTDIYTLRNVLQVPNIIIFICSTFSISLKSEIKLRLLCWLFEFPVYFQLHFNYRISSKNVALKKEVSPKRLLPDIDSVCFKNARVNCPQRMQTFQDLAS